MTTQTVAARIPQWSIGDRLRKIRRDAGLTQADMAARIGVREKALANWETDIAKPRDVFLVAAAVEREFGIPRAWTLGIYGPLDPGPTAPETGRLEVRVLSQERVRRLSPRSVAEAA